MWKKYNEYIKNGIKFKCSSETKELLETQLTEKQLLLLDKREEKIGYVLLITFLYGSIIGAVIYYIILMFTVIS